MSNFDYSLGDQFTDLFRVLRANRKGSEKTMGIRCDP